MSTQILAARVERLEAQMQELATLPERVAALEAQFLQFRSEVRAEFSATREALRSEMRAGDEESWQLGRVVHEDVIGRLVAIQERIDAGDEESRQLARVLHEDVIGRLAAIQERIDAGDEESRHLARILHEDVIGR